MNDSSDKTVSIVTPAHNAAPYIQGAIASVLDQSHQQWELIIIDDASKDNTLELIRAYGEQDKRIKIMTNDRQMGPAVTRNKGIEAARGRYIAFLDSDDLWHSKKLEKQLAFMQERQSPLSYTSYYTINEAGDRLPGSVRVPACTTYAELLNGCVIGCLTAMYDTQLVGKVEMPNILKRQDYALWLKLLRSGLRAHGLDELLAYYRIRSHSVSSNKLLAARYQWKVYREVEKLSLRRSLRHFVSYAYYGYRKHKMS